MTNEVSAAYPEARVTPDNAPMLKRWREAGELVLQHCEGCGKAVFYPRPVCPHCWSDRLVWRPASGKGTVVSFSVIHRGLPAPFDAEAPIGLAEIALEEGISMIARVLVADGEELESGAGVALVGKADAARFPLPTFRIAR
ncbi:Zn-ribbon domain-containing OB-fold protein [Afifella sp. IM 167]|uniref:Zn-ribbon domain-containing OB-fold protein n=1 Tax=Afifella sp. IM 167 TaxID=2033586 RepID=UPI001CCD75E1|nr:zinc ribbon domain-containing protein [Afifella sp. IM 167]MBZ8135144.1 hypothetical protein [Afifella sp. IM 167]